MLHKSSITITLSILILSLSFSFKSFSQTYLDYTYGTLGYAEYSHAPAAVGPNDIKVKVQSDGKIIQAGTIATLGYWQDFIVMRLNNNGSIDSSFANAGKLILSIGTGHDFLKDIAIQPDGKILLAGDSHDINLERSFTLVRLNPNGTLDNSFGTNGIVRTFVVSSLNVDNVLNAIAIQPDNKIVAAGSIRSQIVDMAMVRYNPDGSLDQTFGVNGKVVTHINSNNPGYTGQSYIVDVLIGAANSIIAVGKASFDSSAIINGENWGFDLSNIALVKYNANGEIDQTFGTDGVVLTPMSYFGLPAGANAYSAAITSGDKILVQAEIFNHQTVRNQLGLVLYNQDGSIDNSYGVNGLVTTSFGNSQNFYDLLLDGNDKSIVIGTTSYGTELGFTIFRFNSNGTPDLSFNNGYLYFTSPLTHWSTAWSCAFQGDRLIVGGNSLRDITNSYTHNFLSIRIRMTPVDCGAVSPPLSVIIPDTVSHANGVIPNTVYPGYSPASSITLTAQATGGGGNYTYLWSTNATTQSITVSPLSQTTYTVTAIDGNGCIQSASKTVNVINVDCGNGKIKICHVTNDPAHKNDICVGVSAIEGHLAQGCHLGECIYNIAAQSIGLQAEQQQNTFKLKLYPNPSKYGFRVTAETGNMNEKIQMRVIDVLGRTVERNNNIVPNQTLLIGEKLKAGVYFIIMRQGNKKMIKKVVKM